MGAGVPRVSTPEYPDRYKELIMGAGGENIAPVPIEDNIKKLCPFVSNVMMVGDKRKFNTALVTPRYTYAGAHKHARPSAHECSAVLAATH